MIGIRECTLAQLREEQCDNQLLLLANSFSPCLPFTFCILLEHLFWKVTFTSLPLPTPKWVEHGGKETYKNHEGTDSVSVIPTLCTNYPREAPREGLGFSGPTWAQGFQQLGFRFLGFPLGMNIALTASNFHWGSQRISCGQRVFYQRGSEDTFLKNAHVRASTID